MRSVYVLVIFALLGVPLGAQTYLDRATMGANQDFIARVGVAVQGQAILAEGENPDTCCQSTTQIEMVGKKGVVISLCDVALAAGKPNAPDTAKLLSRDRHAARQRFNRQVTGDARGWATRIAPIIAADTCIPLTVTDTALQSYVVRLWDVLALSPELANAPFEPAAVPPAPPPPPGLLTVPAVPKKPPVKPPGERP